MSASAEAPLPRSDGVFAEADRRISRHKWPFVGRLPLLQTFTLSDVPGQLVLDTAKACLSEAGFSKPVNVEPGSQDRLFYRKERLYYGILLAFRNRVRAPDIQRQKRQQSAAWLVLFFGSAIFMGFAVSESGHGGPIPWGYVSLIVFLPLPLLFVAVYYGVEVLYSWWWEEAVRIVYSGLRPDSSTSTAVAGFPTEVRVWIFGGRVLAGGGPLGHWRRIGADPTVGALAEKWRDRLVGARSMAATRPS